MKKILSTLILILILGTIPSFATDKIRITPDVYKGINKYKQGDYAGCIQEMQKAEASMKDASIPYYYMGNAYIQLGRVEDAKEAYGKVVELNTNSGLVALSKNAVEYLGGPEEYAKKDDIGTFIKSRKFLHEEVIKQLEDKEIENAVQEINNKTNKEDRIDFGKYRYLNDAKGQMPTDEEIANAVKTLAKIGYNPYGGINYGANYQMMNQIGLGNPNDLSSILPYLMAQSNQNGTNNNMNNQLIKSMIMSQGGFNGF